MQYKNTVTGVVISTPCIIKGENWIKLEVEKPKPVKKQRNLKKQRSD